MTAVARLLHPHTLRGKFLAINIPLALIATLVLFALFELNTHRVALENLRQNLDELAATQSAALSNPLWNLDDTQIKLTLAAIVINRDVLGVRIYDETSNAIAPDRRKRVRVAASTHLSVVDIANRPTSLSSSPSRNTISFSTTVDSSSGDSIAPTSSKTPPDSSYTLTPKTSRLITIAANVNLICASSRFHSGFDKAALWVAASSSRF